MSVKNKISSCFLLYSAALLFLNANYSDSESKNREGCRNGDFLLVSTMDGIITALDMESGKSCFSLLLDPEKFLSSSLSELQIYDNGRRVFIVPSLDGGLYKYDDVSRVIQPLPFDVESLITNSAYLDSSTNVIGGKMKIVFGIHRLTGEVVYKCNLDGCTTFNVPFPENAIIVEEIIQCINAVDSVKAEKKWHFRVVELKIKLSSQSSINYPTFSNLKENALIQKSMPNDVNIDTFKVSLEKNFVGLINKSSENFSWIFKAPCPITDAWYLKDDMLQILDPFAKESGFFTVDTEDGKTSAFLFLGLYENQMFVKMSKKFQVRYVDFNSLSTNILFKTYVFPVCPISQDITEDNDTLTEETDLMSSFTNFNVTDPGINFFTNVSIIENANHCIIKTRYIIQYLETSIWSTLYLAIICGFFYSGIRCFQRALKNVESEIQEAEFRSRFHQDFEIISVIGKGGFGVVMDVKNKIDDNRYAVKRIFLHEKLGSYDEDEKVLREVKALAKLDHHGIVRYYNAWTEQPPTGWQEKKDVEFNISDISSTILSSDTEKSSEFDNSESKDESSSKDSKPSILQKCNMKARTVSEGYLYIQMQLCQKESLRDWLIQHSVNRDYNKVMEIFYEIVDAVHYVHNCGMMHRDLKPSNILFSMEGAIKIGDFGLATTSEIEREIDSHNQTSSNLHTSNIGTEFYMSPEQKLNCYDFKTDIYSLGIIFFELIVPFHTRAEWFRRLWKLREQKKFPKKFRKTHKAERKLIEQLLHEDPKCRPTTNEIKQHPLFLNYTTAHK